ncbi:hypothetical protein MRB53_022946 [Persea americana]|uniref:Uncharacterized protein n=1 Tax=Persea americana TaxID=3435 RepID=A0ACC2L991_PERAE|nr:hypothetical protein MRB53_022946 [Persea americana]
MDFFRALLGFSPPNVFLNERGKIEERRGRRYSSLRGGWATEVEENMQQHLQIWNHYQIGCSRKKGWTR